MRQELIPGHHLASLPPYLLCSLPPMDLSPWLMIKHCTVLYNTGTVTESQDPRNALPGCFWESCHLMGALHDGTSPSTTQIHRFLPAGNSLSCALIVQKATDRFPLKLLHVLYLVNRDTIMGLLTRVWEKSLLAPPGFDYCPVPLFCARWFLSENRVFHNIFRAAQSLLPHAFKASSACSYTN